MKKNLLGLFIIISLLFIPKIVYAASTAEKIHFISSANGDSMIIESNGHFGLVDSLDQSSANDVKTYATALGVQHFDFVIMTHNHADSIGGIPELTTLFDSNTIVFYKEDIVSKDSNDQTDDYEELNFNNHYYYQMALSTFNTVNSKTCDVTKVSLGTDPACTLSTLTNSNITAVTYDNDDGSQIRYNVGENLSFDFGDFNIKLYNLYTLAYHRENLNSIVTLVTNKNTGATAVLTGDIEAAISDADYSENAGRSNINTTPTFKPDPDDPSATCEICSLYGIENQIALAVGPVNLLKAANHGLNNSNSLASLLSYTPNYYITTGALTGSDYSSNISAIVFLKAKNTEVYSPLEASRALVAVFSDNSEDITIKNYNASGADTNTALSDLTDGPFEDGWKTIHVTAFDDEEYFYIDNGQPIIDDWADIEKNSVQQRYRFNDSGMMVTGLYMDDLNDTDDSNDKYYYLCESASCLGEMQTGFQDIDYYDQQGNVVTYKFYFRTVADEISTGDKGEMVTGLATIGTDTYYFRTEDDEAFAGPKGSALINGCVEISSQNTCFDSNGILTTSSVPTPKPTIDLCTNAPYTGAEQDIVFTPIGGYTWSNNLQTNVGSYQVTATLNNGYVWDDNSTDPVQITCSIDKAVLAKPTLEEDTYLYDGSLIVPTVDPALPFENPGLVASGDQSATNAGTYHLYVDLLSTANYEWDDGTTGQVDLTWYIASAKYDAPTVAPYNAQYDGTEHTVYVSGDGTPEYSSDNQTWQDQPITRKLVGTTTVYVRIKADSSHVASDSVQSSISITKKELAKPTLTVDSKEYTGSELSPTMSGYDSTTMTASGDTSATNAGDYTITMSLNDTDNYIWDDNSSSAYPLIWHITKASQSAPSITGYNEPYDGSAHTVTVNSAGTVEYSSDALTWSDTAPTLTDVGTIQVYVRKKGDSNHEPSGAVSAYVNITPAKVAAPVLTTTSYNYTGSAITPELTGFDSTIMSKSGNLSETAVSQYTLTISLTNTNYTWMDDTTANIDLTWEIIKDTYPAPSVTGATVVYDGNPHSITVTGAGTMQYSTNGTAWDDTLPQLVDVGALTIYVKRLGDENYNDSNVVSATIKITKASIANPVVTDYTGDYDGSAHTITVEPVSVGTIKYSIDGSSWVTTPPTRTDIGTTTVYVKVFGDANHSNSDQITGTITINAGVTYEINNYPVDETNKYINKIITGTTLEEFKANITLGAGYSVVVDTKTKDGKKLLYTGGKTKILHNGTVVAEYTNIVIGDTNGDGLTDSADLLRMRRHLLGSNPLTGVYKIASDINYDDIVDSADLLRIRQHLLRIRVIGE